MTNKEKQVNNMLQEIAKDIDTKLPEGMGFALLTYEFGEGDDREMLYVSNSNRVDVIKAMLEFVDKNINDPKMFGMFGKEV
jgi:hypothetical protein